MRACEPGLRQLMRFGRRITSHSVLSEFFHRLAKCRTINRATESKHKRKKDEAQQADDRPHLGAEPSAQNTELAPPVKVDCHNDCPRQGNEPAKARLNPRQEPDRRGQGQGYAKEGSPMNLSRGR